MLVKEGSEANLSLKFWRNLVSHIQKQLKKASQYNHVIKSAFEQEYPKLLRVIMNLWGKVKQNKEGFNLMFYGTASCDSSSTSGDMEAASLKGYSCEFYKICKIIVENSSFRYLLICFVTSKYFLVSENNADYDAEMDLRSAISSFRSAFVSISLNNLLSPINSAFTVNFQKHL